MHPLIGHCAFFSLHPFLPLLYFCCNVDVKTNTLAHTHTNMTKFHVKYEEDDAKAHLH